MSHCPNFKKIGTSDATYKIPRKNYAVIFAERRSKLSCDDLFRKKKRRSKDKLCSDAVAGAVGLETTTYGFGVCKNDVRKNGFVMGFLALCTFEFWQHSVILLVILTRDLGQIKLK